MSVKFMSVPFVSSRIMSTFAEKAMLLNQFDSRFPTEESCEAYFRSVREEVGVTCRSCQSKEHKWIAGRKCFECLKCGHRTPLTAGTVMEYSKLPLRTWFYTAHLMTSIKQVLSAKEVQHQLSISYPPVWLLMMKLRDIMGKRENMYTLSGEVELDEAFFPTRMKGDEKDEPLKRGAGSQRQTKVLVIVESKPADELLVTYLESLLASYSDAKAKKVADLEKKVAKKAGVKKAVNYIKMFVLENLEAGTIERIAGRFIDEDAKVVTDGSKSHVKFKTLFNIHESHVEYDAASVVRTNLPWVHIVIGECRSGIEAIHKEVEQGFLQLYLNEYCWKFNRRFFRDSTNPKDDLFDRLVKISAMFTSDIKYDRNAEDTSDIEYDM